MKVAYIYADSPMEWNCSEWRMLAPSDAINAAASTNPKYSAWSAKLIHVSGFSNYLDPVIQDYIMPADIVIVQRNVVVPGIIDAIRYYQGLGKVVAIDLDDAYQMLPWSNPAHKFWTENAPKLEPDPLTMLERGLSYCDGLIAPNRFLLNDWSHVTRGYYIPNFARGEWWTDLPDRATLKTELDLSGRIIIGWGGSVSHYDSWHGSGLREAAVALTRRYPELLWMVCGNDPRIYDQLDVPTLNKYHQPGVDPAEWPKIVCRFDIGVAPLHGIYDQRRSWIKGLEYGLAGIPWVATAGEPYRDLKDLGVQIVNTPDNWYRALADTINNLPGEQEMAASRVPIFRKWLVENQLDNLASVYKTVIANASARRGALQGIHWVNWPTSRDYSINTVGINI